MTTSVRNQMLGLISAGVLLNFIVGIFSARIEELIGVSPALLAIITFSSLLLLSIVNFRIWLEERKALTPNIPQPASPKSGSISPGIHQPKWPLDRVLAFIPLGMVAGAILAIVLVPLFPKVLFFTVNLPEITGWNLLSYGTFEFVGIGLLLIAAVVIAIRWHGTAALLLLFGGITAFSAMCTILHPENQDFLASVIGWGIFAVLALAIVRGIAALFGK